MYALDNDSGVQTMPEVKAKKFNHTEPRWFTEGGNGVAPSYPGADWFNIVQAELLGVLTAGGIEPDKANLNQLTLAIQQVVQNKVTQALSSKANSNSPLLTGIPTAPTAPQSTNNTQIATTAFVKAAIAALVGAAPSSLDTLNELATALNNNANFATSIINQLAGKANNSHTHTYSQITDFESGVNKYINQRFTQNLNETGWTKSPNGLILQWGKINRQGVFYEQVTYPITFTSKLLHLSITQIYLNNNNTQRSEYGAGVKHENLSGFKLNQTEHDGVAGIYWCAIGV